jgi:heme/copper-type cytochrome/quinol oxidase subunit 3
MEVHSHSHTPRKKWTHYFWEFLMLFLAVFCGFLAEYQLEHVIEHQREKQYMQSMIEDLKSDTAMFVSNIQIRNSRIVMMDSLVLLLTSSAPE